MNLSLTAPDLNGAARSASALFEMVRRWREPAILGADAHLNSAEADARSKWPVMVLL